MSYISEQLKGKKVLVTGATGFIGGRLAQRLAVEEHAVVTGLGRSLDKAPFLQEAEVALKQVDLQDETAMKGVIAEQDYIFHVAAWLGGGRVADAQQEAYALNVTATENILFWAKEADVQRIIVVSTIGAYGIPTTTHVAEDTPLDIEQADTYGRTKAIGELKARELAQDLGIELTIVRPALVYGPRSKSWTVNMLQLVQKGTPVIFGDGNGLAMPVFIDNLIDGMLLTAVSPNAVGEAFNFCDPQISWKQFFGYYGKMCGQKPRQMPLLAARLLAIANRILKLGLPLNKARLSFLTQKAVYPTAKAEKLLGYTPRVQIDVGMMQAEQWLREEGYLE